MKELMKEMVKERLLKANKQIERTGDFYKDGKPRPKAKTKRAKKEENYVTSNNSRGQHKVG